ncbi:hypothetical protein D3C73_1469990 [compost metagenome]
MRLLADDVLIATFAMGHQAQQVAHGARGHEQRGGKPESTGQFGFQAIDCRILTIDVVAGGCRGHCLEHPCGRLGDGVAAKINNTHESGLGIGRSRRCR